MNKICRRAIFFMTCFFLLLLTSSTQATDSVRPVGLIITVSGEVNVSSEKESKPAIEGYVLQEGDTVIVKIGARCGGFGLDGEPFKLTGPSLLVLTVRSKSGTSKIAAMIARQLAQWAGEGRRKALVSRGIRDWQRPVKVPAPIIPASDGCVRPNRSGLCWTTIAGVVSYTVSIAPTEGKELHRTIHGHKFTLDDLESGMNFVWKIGAKVDGTWMNSVWSSFRIMELEEENQLDEALSGLSELEAGVVLFTVGLHEEAIYRLDAAVDCETDRRSALSWRAKVLASIGFHKEAYEDVLKSIER